jgi:hypothetical protein
MYNHVLCYLTNQERQRNGPLVFVFANTQVQLQELQTTEQHQQQLLQQ